MSIRNVIAAKDETIRRQTYAIAGLAAACALLWFGWKSAPQDISIHIPPDLRNGASVQVGQITPPSVYAFGYYIFQQLNRWPTNGEVDYAAKLNALQNYMTPSCLDDRQRDLKARGQVSELTNRVRSVQEMPGRGFAQNRVRVESADSWVIFLDLQVQENFRGQPVKNTYVQFPLRVVRYPVDLELNPFQLAIDCFAGDPKRLEVESAIKVTQP